MKCCTPSGLEGQEQQKDETNKEIVKAAVVNKQKPRMAGDALMAHAAVMPDAYIPFKFDNGPEQQTKPHLADRGPSTPSFAVEPMERRPNERVLKKQVMPEGWRPPQRGTSRNNRGPTKSSIREMGQATPRPTPGGMGANTQPNKRDYKAEFRMMLQQQSLDRLRNNPRYGTRI